MASSNHLRGRSSAAGGPPSSHAKAYARRSSSGRFSSFAEDMDNSSDLSTVNVGYTVQIPPTPDNQPMMMGMGLGMGMMDVVGMRGEHPPVGKKTEQQMVSNNIFTGGFNSMTKSHMLDKMTEGAGNANSQGSVCRMKGCDARIMRDEQGNDRSPCDCDFMICRDCYVESGGVCPGCKEPYKAAETDDPFHNDQPVGAPLSLPAPDHSSKMERSLSVVKPMQNNQLSMRNQVNEFDHAYWLYETKGTYGFGNAVWPQEPDPHTGVGGEPGNPPDFKSTARRPLSRKIKVSAGILSPYR